MTAERWLSTAEFAGQASICGRRARAALARCHSGGTWRGLKLAVRVVCGRGGRGGVVYEVRQGSLPPELGGPAVQAALPDLLPGPPPARAAGPKRQKTEAERHAIVREALLPGAGPRAMVAARHGVSERALRDWIRAWRGSHPKDPSRGLRRKPPKSRGEPRAPLPRPLARALAAAGADQAALAMLAAKLDYETGCLWSSPISRAGATAVARHASGKLEDLVGEAFPELAIPDLVALCRVSRFYVERFSRRRYKAVDLDRHDAKAAADSAPYVPRERPRSPFSTVETDGTSLDVRFLRFDGSECKVWLQLWLDRATNRLFEFVLGRGKGRGIRQEHVILSFCLLSAEVAMADLVVADRGPENGWTDDIEPFCRVTKTLPYNARAKRIEAVIRVLMKHYISQLPGYIGSDRMRKKTQAAGRPTAPFPGSFQELCAAIERCVAVYNATPQRTLGNRSPNDVWQAAIDDGWTPRRADIHTLVERLSRAVPVTVRNGGVTINNDRHSSDALCARADLEGVRCLAKVPRVTGFPPVLYDPDGRFISLIYVVERYPDSGPAGARESARLRKLRRHGSRTLAAARPPADPSTFQRRFLEHNPPPPEIAGEVVYLSDPDAPAARARRAGGPPALPAPPPAAADDIGAAHDRFIATLKNRRPA